MLDTPEFSVVIPNHNGGRYVGRAIASVARQREVDGRPLEGIEVLLGYDACTDNSAYVVGQRREEFRTRFVRFVEYHYDARSVNGGLNRLIPLTRGKYYTRLDVDDELQPEALARSRNALEKAGPDVSHVFTHTQGIDEHGNWLDVLFSQPYDVAELLCTSYTACSSLTRAELMRGMVAEQPLDETILVHEKPEPFIRMALKGYRGLFVDDERLRLLYRWHEKNKSDIGVRLLNGDRGKNLSEYWSVPDTVYTRQLAAQLLVNVFSQVQQNS